MFVKHSRKTLKAKSKPMGVLGAVGANVMKASSNMSFRMSRRSVALVAASPPAMAAPSSKAAADAYKSQHYKEPIAIHASVPRPSLSAMPAPSSKAAGRCVQEPALQGAHRHPCLCPPSNALFIPESAETDRELAPRPEAPVMAMSRLTAASRLWTSKPTHNSIRIADLEATHD